MCMEVNGRLDDDDDTFRCQSSNLFRYLLINTLELCTNHQKQAGLDRKIITVFSLNTDDKSP